MQKIVVVGASLAGVRTVEALRRGGYTGSIVWLGEEPHLPYDRPPLSKEVLRGEWGKDKLALRKESYGPLQVDLRLGVRATELDWDRREVRAGEERYAFDGLVIATGARVRRLQNPDALSGIHVIRTLDDALAAREALSPKTRLVVIGAGFIGLEVAASARKLGASVTVIEALSVPLERQLGARMGQVVLGLHRAEGVDLRTGIGVSGFEGEGGRVRGVRLSDGSRIEADLVIEGIGVIPNVEWLQGSPIQLENGVVCDESCRAVSTNGAALDGVVAVGDVANFFNPLYGERMRVEHWTHAVEQADHAAETLLGKPRPFATAPVFWSDQYGIKIQFAGRAKADDQVHVCHGTIEEKRFVALYGRGEKLVGVLTFKRPPQLIKYRAMIEQGVSFAEAVAQAK